MMMAGEEIEREYDPGDGNDKTYSTVSIAMWLYLFINLVFIGYMVREAIAGRRRLTNPGLKKWVRFARVLLCCMPFAAGLYLLPQALFGFNWAAMMVWSPGSFGTMVASLIAGAGLTFVTYLVSLFLPEPNEYKRRIPQIMLLSILSGLANVAVIITVTSFIDSDVPIGYLVFYYSLIIALYLIGRRFVQINLIRFARGLVYDLRMQLIHKVFSTSYDRFEKIDRGRVYTALNDDVNTLGQSANMMVGLITSTITAVGAFVYLGSVALWATLLTISLIVALATLYYYVARRTNVFFEKARDSRDVFMRLINGMIDGFKEISLHKRKKIAYKADVATSAKVYRDKVTTADIRFTDAFMVGESFLVVLLGLVAIGMMELFPNIRYYTIMSFVIVLLYLIGPVNEILNSVPGIMNLRIAWQRVKRFINELPANLDLDQIPERSIKKVADYAVDSVTYQFKDAEGNATGFKVGPVSFQLNAGQILFIIGGNGSGKTTLAKMLTGLYAPDRGQVRVNGQAMKPYELSEYFSTVFSPAHLFEKLYNIDTEAKAESIDELLELLDLHKKVTIQDNHYNTIRLSGGQQKRLALLQCYLEDTPIYLFDEWAADQDPSYRNFFYRTLLPEMRRQGKIVIAITHDDHYFDVADKVVKMNQGKLEEYSGAGLFEKVEMPA